MCLTPSSSVIVNIIVPIPDTIVLPVTPVTPTFGAGRMFTNKFNHEQIWSVAQLSVPNSVGSFVNEYTWSDAAYFVVLCRAKL